MKFVSRSRPQPQRPQTQTKSKRGDSRAVRFCVNETKIKRRRALLFLPMFAASPASGAIPPRRAHDTFQSVAAKVSEWVTYFEKVMCKTPMFPRYSPFSRTNPQQYCIKL